MSKLVEMPPAHYGGHFFQLQRWHRCPTRITEKSDWSQISETVTPALHPERVKLISTCWSWIFTEIHADFLRLRYACLTSSAPQAIVFACWPSTVYPVTSYIVASLAYIHGKATVRNVEGLQHTYARLGDTILTVGDR